MEFTHSEASWATRPYREILDVGGSDGSIAVVPVGSIEQHGHHLPVATDTILVDAVAHEGAERVADDLPILVTPPVWAGNSPHHMVFGGTLSVGVRELLDTLEELADCVLENGFDAVVFLNGHGGNVSTIGDAVSIVGDARPDAEVLGLTYFDLAADAAEEIRDSEVGGMAHGGEFETSLMLHLRPDLVREDRPDRTPLDDAYELRAGDLFDSGPLSAYRTFDEYSPTGAIGEPELADEEKGERLFERVGDELEDFFRAVHEENS